MKKKILIGVFMFILLALTVGLYSLNNKLDPSSMNGLPVNASSMATITTVEKRNIISSIQATGNIKAEETEDFILEQGKKVKYYVKDGEEVTKGRLLYQIIDPELDLQYKQALADKKQLSKASATTATNPIPPTPSPSLNDINTQINSLKERLEANKVKAPFTGIVSIVTNQTGSQGPIPSTIKLSNLNSLIIPVNIEEVDYPLIKVGQKAKVKLTAYGNRSFIGTVSRISKEAFNKDGNVTIPVLIKLTKNPAILPGMSAEVSISISSKSNVLALPSEYIQQNEKGEDFVNLVKKGAKADGDQGTPPEIRIVKVGLKDDTHVEILAGLKEGEIIQGNGSPNSSNVVMQVH